MIILRKASFKKTLLYAVTGGVLMGAYGNFAAYLPVILLAYFYARISAKEKISSIVLKSAIIGVAFSVPFLAWVAFLHFRNGAFYALETANYRQFVWVFDAMKLGVGPFLDVVSTNFLEFFRTFKSIEIIPACVVAAVLFVWVRFVRKIHEPKSMVPLLVFSVFLFFTMFMGYYQTRITFCLIPPLLVLIGIDLDYVLKTSSPGVRKRIYLFMLAFNLVWAGFHVFKYGPFI